MASCKRHVYKTMCEQADGQRRGKYGSIKYESTPKRGSVKSKTKRKGKA